MLKTGGLIVKSAFQKQKEKDIKEAAIRMILNDNIDTDLAVREACRMFNETSEKVCQIICKRITMSEQRKKSIILFPRATETFLTRADIHG